MFGPASGYLYIITNKSWPGWLKVGTTRNLKSRLQSYQTSSPFRDYEVIYSIKHPAYLQAEQNIKKQMAYFAKFIAYIKNVENAASEGRSSNGVWVQHSSPEGGSDTFGYGHKIKRGEDFSQGRTDAQVDALLVDDLQAAENIVRREIGTDVYNKLDPKRKQMLIEFAFNLGTLRGFPLFTKAVIDNDIDVMRAEHHRTLESG